jgi:restriction endonuclease
VVATLIGRQAAPNVVAMIEDLIAHITPPIKLTRRTLTAIVTQTKNRQAALDNPQEFALQAARIVREKAVQQLVDGIQYLKDGTWYDMSEWVEEEETVSERLIAVDNSIYDHIVVQSETEKKFVEKLKKMKNVHLFIKLPNWFKVGNSGRPIQPGLGHRHGTGLWGRRPSAVLDPRDEEQHRAGRSAWHRGPEDSLRKAALRWCPGS